MIHFMKTSLKVMVFVVFLWRLAFWLFLRLMALGSGSGG